MAAPCHSAEPALETVDRRLSDTESELLLADAARNRQETPVTDEEAIRARLSLKLVLFAIGVGAGSVPSCYLASVGFYAQRLSSQNIFGFQILVVQGVVLFTIVLQQLLDDRYDSYYGVARACGFRIIFSGVAQCALALVMPICSSAALVLLVGALSSFLSTSQWSSAAQLGAVLLPGGSMLVGVGTMVGNASTVLTAPLLGFGPDSSTRLALLFHGIGASFAAVGTSCFCFHHMSIYQDAKSGFDRDRRKTISGRLSLGYESILESQERRTAQGVGHQSRTRMSVVTTLLFVNMFTTFFPTPMFTLVDPWLSQHLMLSKLAGDALGRFVAVAQSSKYGRNSAVEFWVRQMCVFLVVARVILAPYIVHTLFEVANNMMAPDAGNMLSFSLLLYTMGSYADGMLNLDAQLMVPEGDRKTVTRVNVLSASLGGVMAALMGLTLRQRYGLN